MYYVVSSSNAKLLPKRDIKLLIKYLPSAAANTAFLLPFLPLFVINDNDEAFVVNHCLQTRTFTNPHTQDILFIASFPSNYDVS